MLAVVVGATGCDTGELDVGEIHFPPNRLLQGGKLSVGLGLTALKPLPNRIARCYRCLEAILPLQEE